MESEKNYLPRSWQDSFVLHFFAANSSIEKMLKIDLKKEENLISSDNLHLGVGVTRAISKCTATQVLEVRKFKQNAVKFFIHLVEKLKD